MKKIRNHHHMIFMLWSIYFISILVFNIGINCLINAITLDIMSTGETARIGHQVSIILPPTFTTNMLPSG